LSLLSWRQLLKDFKIDFYCAIRLYRRKAISRIFGGWRKLSVLAARKRKTKASLIVASVSTLSRCVLRRHLEVWLTLTLSTLNARDKLCFSVIKRSWFAWKARVVERRPIKQLRQAAFNNFHQAAAKRCVVKIHHFYFCISVAFQSFQHGFIVSRKEFSPLEIMNGMTEKTSRKWFSGHGNRF
jgi:hypothetical protein